MEWLSWWEVIKKISGNFLRGGGGGDVFEGWANFWGRLQFLGHLHFWGCLHLPRRSCLFSLSSFWDVVFINEVIFRFEVSFNFEVIFTLRGHPHCCLISWSQKKSVNFCLNSKLCHNIPMKKKWNLYEMFTLSLAQLWPSLSDIFHAYYLGL